MSQPGNAVEVLLQPRGSQLVGNHSAGATTLLVDDPTQFDESGGQVLVDGVAYTYTTVTEVPDTVDTSTTNGQLPLPSGLVAAVGDGLPVEGWSGTQVLNDVALKVVIGDEADPPVVVLLTVAQRTFWEGRPGPMDPPVAVTLSDDLTRLEDAPGYSPEVTGQVRLNYPDGGLTAFFAGAAPDDETQPRVGTQILFLEEDGVTQVFNVLRIPATDTNPTGTSAIGGLADEVKFTSTSSAGMTLAALNGPMNLLSDEGVILGSNGFGSPINGYDRGTFTGNTDGSGQVSIPHGLHLAPVGVSLTVAGGPAFLIVRRVSRSSSAVVAQCNNSTTGAALGSGVAVAIDWIFTA